MMKVFAIILFITFSTTVFAKKYVEPITDSANIRIVLINPEAYSVHIAEYNPIACKKGSDVGWVSGGRKIDMVRTDMPGSEAPREGILERRIPANQSIAFGTSFIMPKQSILTSLMGATSPNGASATALADAQAAICEVPIFTALPGENYELHLQPLPKACEITLYRFTANPDGSFLREKISTPRISFPVSITKPSCPNL